MSASTAFFQPGITAVRPGLYRTTDGGRIFVKLRGLPAAFGTNGLEVTDMSFADDLDGFALLSTGLIFRTPWRYHLDTSPAVARLPIHLVACFRRDSRGRSYSL